MREGLLQAIATANRSPARRNVIVYEGDGGTTCPGHDSGRYAEETLAAVKTANHKKHRINVICAGAIDVNTAFCKALAAIGRGQYKRIAY